MTVIDRNMINDWTRLGMRKAYGSIIESLATDCTDFIVLTADVADSANLVSFSKKYSDRFYNIGIAEQCMTGIACGMAKEGQSIFICSFAPFVSMRNYEAIRSLIGYMNLNVKIVALASGVSLGVQGATHYCLEDISLMKSIPNMLLLSPADVIEEARCIEYLMTYKGPAYLRLSGIDGTPTVFGEDYVFDIKKPSLLREGDSTAIISTGSIAAECLRATRALKKEGIDSALYSICCLNPINRDELIPILTKYSTIVSVEEHFKKGGLGSIIAEIIAESGLSCKLIRAGIDDCFPHPGDYSYVLASNKLDAKGIVNTILSSV